MPLIPRPNWPRPARSSQTPSRRSSRWRLPWSASGPSSGSSSANPRSSTASSTSRGRSSSAVTAEYERVAALLDAGARAGHRDRDAHRGAPRADRRARRSSSGPSPTTSTAAPPTSRSARHCSRSISERAYERSQTSLLEVILLSADSLDEATTQVGYLMTVSEQDTILADDIRAIRERARDCDARRSRDGRRALAEARAVARDEEAIAQGAPRRAHRARGPARRAAAAAAEKRGRAGGGAQRGARGEGQRRAADRRQRTRRPPRPSRLAAPAAAAGRRPAGGHRGGEAPAPPRPRRGARPPRQPARRGRQRDLGYGFRWPERSVPGHPGVGTDQLRARAAVHVPRHLLPALPRRDRLRERLRDADLRRRRRRRRRLGPAAQAVGLRATAWSSTTAAGSRPGTGTCSHARRRRSGDDRDQRVGHRLRGHDRHTRPAATSTSP